MDDTTVLLKDKQIRNHFFKLMFYSIGTYIIPKKVAQTDGVTSSFTMWVQCLFHAFKCGQHFKEFEREFVFGQAGHTK